VSHADPRHYDPTNITFGILPPPEAEGGRRPLKGGARKTALSARALVDLNRWCEQVGWFARAGEPEPVRSGGA
jgi:methylenetetrahydrofolate--tRNA-(uracil-5-)-methyltransferase